MDEKNNGWNEYEKLVLAELKRLGGNQNRMNCKLDGFMSQVQTELAVLKLKAGVWGAAAGAIPLLIGLFIAILSGWL